ncbi:MAG: SGNH/GDSL hydrolase family protein [Nitrospirota bacterium]|nr:SGNH/GDSL hydrolase family protein [Nitrospirota bacterium]
MNNILLLFTSIATFFLLLELSLALFAPHKLRIQPYHETYDPVMGWVNKPLKDEGVHFEFARDRFFQVRHNSLGLRGPETTKEKPRGTKRILLVGDSFFWGYGVSDDNVLSAVLQKELPPAVEVLNGGTTGYGTDQAHLWLKHAGLSLQPNIVLFGFTAANDLDEIASSVQYYSPKPLFMLEGGELVLKNVPVPRSEQTDRKTFGKPRTLFGKVKKFLRFHTHTYQFIMGRLNSNPEIRLLLINLGLAEEYSQDIGDIPVLTNPPEQVREIAFRLIRESRKAAEASGAAFVLVFIPEKEEDRSGRVQLQGVKEGTYERNSALSAALSAFSRRERIPYLDLLPFSRTQCRQGLSLYTVDRSDHHWTADGHRRIAGEVLQFLRKERLLP